MPDKYTAVWLSHSSISDFLLCPKAYYLKNVYKDPKTGHKVQMVSPALSLGSIVHQVVESLSVLPADKRFQKPLLEKFNQAWSEVAGKKGGFLDTKTENEYKQRGLDMLNMLTKNPGPLVNLAVKINMDLPFYWLSEEDNLILCGKIDWLEFLKDKDAVHIIDFKTGRYQEQDNSLQLPIYHLLVLNCQQRPVAKASYWYLASRPKLTSKTLPDPVKSTKKILKIGKKIKLARQLNHYNCPNGDKGCSCCQPFKQILKGHAEYVGTDGFRDKYLVDSSLFKSDQDSVVL